MNIIAINLKNKSYYYFLVDILAIKSIIFQINIIFFIFKSIIFSKIAVK